MEASSDRLSKGTRLAVSETSGRYVIATQDFETGSLVLSQFPYQAVLYEDQVRERCGYCLERKEGLSVCGKSKYSRYCSRDHQKCDWLDGYKEESGALKELAPKSPPPTVRLAARVLWKSVREQFDSKLAGKWERYEDVCGLVDHWDQLRDERKQAFAQMAMLTRTYMSKRGDLSQNGGEMTLPSPRDIALLLARFACNNHTICDAELRPIGVGIYPMMCMVNHSCNPNCAQVFSGRKLEFRAIRQIHTGEEITISYVDLLATFHERRLQLLSNYHFDIYKNASGNLGNDNAQSKEGKPPPRRTYAIDEKIRVHKYECGNPPWVGWDRKDVELTSICINGKEEPNAGAMVSFRELHSGIESRDEHDDVRIDVQLWGEWVSKCPHDIVLEFGRRMANTAVMHKAANQGSNSSWGGEELTALQDAFTDLRNLICTDSWSMAIAQSHVLYARVGSSLLKALIDGGDKWYAALEAARKLVPAFEVGYPEGSPNLGLHLAGLAKLEVLCGDPREGLKFANEALRILSATHGSLGVFEEVRRVRYDAECALNEGM